MVQLLKLPLDRVWKVPTRMVAYMVALVVLVLAQVFGGGITWDKLALCLINAVLVSLSAMAAYEVAIGGVEKSKIEDAAEGTDKPRTAHIKDTINQSKACRETGTPFFQPKKGTYVLVKRREYDPTVSGQCYGYPQPRPGTI